MPLECSCCIASSYLYVVTYTFAMLPRMNAKFDFKVDKTLDYNIYPSDDYERKKKN